MFKPSLLFLSAVFLIQTSSLWALDSPEAPVCKSSGTDDKCADTQVQSEEEEDCPYGNEHCGRKPNGVYSPGPTEPGQIVPLTFADGSPIDPYAFRIGLPEKLTAILQEYVKEMGILELFRYYLYQKPLKPGGNEYVSLNGFKWYIQRPQTKWHSNMHWLSVGDDDADQQANGALGRGGFDMVLDALGRHFNLDGLVIISMGFIAVSHCTDATFMHDDFSDTGGKSFNILIPLEIQENSPPELWIRSAYNESVVAGVDYEYGTGVGLGDDTIHGTGAVDYRHTGGFRLAAPIYMMDVNEDNVENVLAAYTDPYPPADAEHILARAGKHWKKDGSVSLPKWTSYHRQLDDELDNDCPYGKEHCGRKPNGSYSPGPTEPGQIVPLTFADGSPIDPYTFRIGLPDRLTSVLQEYVKEMGILDLFHHYLYQKPLKPGKDEYVNLNGYKWYIQRPKSKWHSNMHWLSVGDDAADEQANSALGRGGFDMILDALGQYFNLDGLVIISMGFIAVSHCTDATFMHHDFTDTGGKSFNILIPLEVQENSPPELWVRSAYNKSVVAGIDYEYGTGVGLGDDTIHGTGAVDYRHTGGFRLAAPIYMMDVNEDNVENVLEAYTDPYPPADAKHILARAGKHWRKDGSVNLPKWTSYHRQLDE